MYGKRRTEAPVLERLLPWTQLEAITAYIVAGLVGIAYVLLRLANEVACGGREREMRDGLQ
jgi:hypothetical protein